MPLVLLAESRADQSHVSLYMIEDEAKQKSAYTILTECDSSGVYKR